MLFKISKTSDFTVSSPLNNKFPSILFNSFFFFVSRETTSQRNVKRKREREKKRRGEKGKKKRRNNPCFMLMLRHIFISKGQRGNLSFQSFFGGWFFSWKIDETKKTKRKRVRRNDRDKIWNDRLKTICFSAGTVVHRGPVHGGEHCGSEHRTIRSLQRGSL